MVVAGDPQDLAVQVSKFLTMGWSLHGGIVVWRSNDLDRLCQMVVNTETDAQFRRRQGLPPRPPYAPSMAMAGM